MRIRKRYLLSVALTILSLIALVLLAWQWAAGARFPLHFRLPPPDRSPGVTLLKPLKGVDSETEPCLRSWLNQQWPGDAQFLFAAEPGDAVCDLVRRLLTEFPGVDAELVTVEPPEGFNSKVWKLAALQTRARHDLLVISDADVLAPPDLLVQLAASISQTEAGLVTCFYRMADPQSWPERWEHAGANCDFWSQVLQSKALRPMDFALGAVMALTSETLKSVGGFGPLVVFLADDYELGRRVVRAGKEIQLCQVVVECRGGRSSWKAAWQRQLRWARTIRVCQPVPYFFSILANTFIFPALLFALDPALETGLFVVVAWGIRVLVALDLERRLGNGRWKPHLAPAVLMKDCLQVAVWFLAFTGNTVRWRGKSIRIKADGTISA